MLGGPHKSFKSNPTLGEKDYVGEFMEACIKYAIKES